MKILAFGASNSSNSINKKFAASVSKYYKEAVDVVEVIDLNDFELPLFSKDIEKEIGLPEAATRFAAKIDQADFLIISFAENNGNYNVGYKNLVDWTSRIKDRKLYNGKPVLLLATSRGTRGGQSVLDIATTRMPFDGAEVLETFSLPEYHINFEEGKGIITPLFRSQLEAKVRKTKRILQQRTSD